MEEKLIANELIKFIDKSPCAYFVTSNIKNYLEENDYKELHLSQAWDLKIGKYFIINNDSSIIAFNIADEDENGFKIIASHTDSPGFRIKTSPIIKRENNVVLNTEVYGGPIISTWLDRVLSVAGRVVLKTETLSPEVKLLNIEEDLLTIPNAAIHMNREVNKGFEYNPQKHTLPLLLLTDEKLTEDLFIKIIAEKLNVKEEDILDYDMYLYNREKSSLVGLNQEFISAGRLDNLAMVYTSLKAFTNSTKGINVFIATDNEEVGSRTRQGADSPMIEQTLERICIGLKKSREEYLRAIENSYIISADMAHAVHPNFVEFADPTNKPLLSKGPVIKYAANKAYTSDGLSAAVFKSLCERAQIPYQSFYNRSDKMAGSTIGPLTASHLNIRSVDIGNPMLSMHSVRELASVDDTFYAYKVFKEFYSN